jgi:hypothetical protein
MAQKADNLSWSRAYAFMSLLGGLKKWEIERLLDVAELNKEADIKGGPYLIICDGDGKFSVTKR